MAYFLHRYQEQFPAMTAASDLAARRPVKLNTVVGEVVLAATAADRPQGMTGEASALRAAKVAVYDDCNIVKAVAAASIAAHAEVTVGSDNGAIGPTIISASAHWAVGQALESANPGEVFTLYIKARKA